MINSGRNKGNNISSRPDIINRLPQSHIPWKRSKDDVWDSLKNSIEEQPDARIITLGSRILRLSAAAVILLLVSSVTFMRLYNRTVTSQSGEIASIALPGGSKLMLNAETTIKYHPLWWKFNREINLDGEAYFEVTKGNEFTVTSEPGTTTVLGTTFNIYSRDGEYEVSCYTGKVKVGSVISGREIIIESNQKASLGMEGSLEISKEIERSVNQDWRSGYFRFTSSPVKRVFDEISRQFGIYIKGTEDLDLIYTGNFRKDQSINEVMNLVCKAFGIDFVSEDEKTYRIVVDAD